MDGIIGGRTMTLEEKLLQVIIKDTDNYTNTRYQIDREQNFKDIKEQYGLTEKELKVKWYEMQVQYCKVQK